MLAGLEQAALRFGPRLEAAYAIGSLAHGGFAPAASSAEAACRSPSSPDIRQL